MKTAIASLLTFTSLLFIDINDFVVCPTSTQHYKPSSSSPLASTATASATTTTTTTTTATSWQFKQAGDDDMALVEEFLQQKGAFDRGVNGNQQNKGLTATPGETLGTLFPELPQGRVLLIGKQQNQLESNTFTGSYADADADADDYDPIGFAMYALRHYGLGTPPSLWLEDLFVDPSKRSGGAGKALMQQLAAIGQDHACTHLSWKCDHRNERGMDFYQRVIGATKQNLEGTCVTMKWVPASWTSES